MKFLFYLQIPLVAGLCASASALESEGQRQDSPPFVAVRISASAVA